ncbi:MAG: GNAT family N-acetyltransferase [Bacteroidota bacterium]
MQIRKAKLEDALAIAHLLFLATGEVIYTFIRERNEQKAVNFLHHFISGIDNQYSYQNCWVIEGEEDEVLAAASVYDGGNLFKLRSAILNYITINYGALPFTLEDETEPGEYYIDSIGVSPNHQGKGLGSLLLKFLIEEYAVNKKETLGLLVDDTNPNAKKLYLSLGFKVVKKVLFTGKPMEHLQR